jgi:hypothetical protein
MELNFNCAKVNSSANLVSWFCEEERKIRSVTAHNTTEYDEIFGKHQPGGIGLVCRHEFAQYVRKPAVNPRGLGWWCLWPFSCNPIQVSRIVVSYRPCFSKVKGLKDSLSTTPPLYTIEGPASRPGVPI